LLKSNTRSQLKKHNWLHIEKEISNPSQKLKRIRDLSITGINDLALIAEKTPEDLQDEIFTTRKVEPLIDRVLKLKFSLSHLPSVNRLDTRRTQLSSMLVSKSIMFLKLQYEFLEHDTPELANIILKQLSQAEKISNEIANKVELLNIRNVANKSKLEYLFNWKKVTEKDERLWSFLYGELGVPFAIENIHRSPNDRTLRFKLVSEFGDVFSTVTVAISGEDEKAMLVIENNSIKIERKLIIRREKDELYVFRKNNNQ